MALDSSAIVGFFSYSRRDDEHSMGGLSRLRSRIQSELRLQMGRDFRLWQDTAAIPEGALWENEINKAIAESYFFIPIVTPSAISSPHCSFEFSAFLRREVELGRNDLIFPILYITVEGLVDERQWRESELLKVIGSRQYLDWRKYRHQDPGSTDVALQIEQFCGSIYKALRRPLVTPEERRREEQAEAKRKVEEQQRRKREIAETQRRAKEDGRRKRAEAEALARAEEKQLRQEAEARQRAETERAFSAAKRADTVKAVDSFLLDHPRSHLGTQAVALRSNILARDEAARAKIRDQAEPDTTPHDSDATDNFTDALKSRFSRLQLGDLRLSPVVLVIAAALIVAVVAGGIWLVTKRQPVQSVSAGVLPLSLAREQALKPKDSFNECDNCPDMVVVPAGNFTMGSPNNEPGRNPDEPQVNVVIARPFAVGKFAVTFNDWDACTSDGGCNGYAPPDAGWGRGQRPVINVSWTDAQAYVDWLSHKTGKTYRLLSEAEREYVTRAGTTTPFWWGTSIAPAQANYNASYVYQGGGSKGDYRAQTVPVRSFAANPWGLYQVHGNVWEWTDDCWNETNTGNPGNGAARNSGDCDHRVVRGGSWYNSPAILRAASRGNYPTESRNQGFGFRIARTLNP